MQKVGKVSKLLKYILPALIVLVIVILALYEPALSKDQKNVIKLYGYPSQFVITYLPRWGDMKKDAIVVEKGTS